MNNNPTGEERLRATFAWIEAHEAFEDVAGIPTRSEIHFVGVAAMRKHFAGSDVMVSHECSADHYEVCADGIRFTACELVKEKRETVRLSQ